MNDINRNGMRTEKQYWDHWTHSHRWFLRTNLILCVFTMTLLVLLFFIPVTQGLSGNGGSNDPWITSSPVTYYITDSTPTGSSVLSDGLILSSDMETMRSGNILNFACDNTSQDGTFEGSSGGIDQGIRGNGTYLDGSVGNYIVYPQTGWFNEPNISQELTVSIWIKPVDTNGGGIDKWGSYSLSYEGGFCIAVINRGFAPPDTQIISYAYTSTNWFMMTMVYDHVVFRLFINGEEKDFDPVVTDIKSYPLPVLLGKNSGGGNYKGFYDEPLIASRAWNGSEVFKHYEDTFTKYNVQTGTHYSYQAVQNQTTFYPAWSVSSNAPNVTIDSVGKVMGYWESWQNGTYWINVTVQNTNGYAWQNYSVVVVESAPLSAIFQLTDQMIIGLFFYIICLVISLIGFRYEKTILCIIVLGVALFTITIMLTIFATVSYIPLLFLLILGIMPILTYKK